MRVKAGIYLLFLLLLGFPALLCAQNNDDPQVETDWDDYKYELFARGDQTFIISLGLVFPLFAFNNEGTIPQGIDPPVGGTGSLGFNYYLNSKLYIGGEIAGMFLSTIGGSTLYMIPLGFKIGTQLVLGRFEFPVSAVLGVTWHTYLDLGYFGFYAKASVCALFRATKDWAFGITSSYYFFPEWTGNPKEDAYGNFLDLNLTARYQY